MARTSATRPRRDSALLVPLEFAEAMIPVARGGRPAAAAHERAAHHCRLGLVHNGANVVVIAATPHATTAQSGGIRLSSPVAAGAGGGSLSLCGRFERSNPTLCGWNAQMADG